jgi:hypothetical protein
MRGMTMTELRAPDPTLDQWNHYGEPSQPGVVGFERNSLSVTRPGTAHLRAKPDERGGDAACGGHYDAILYASEARWFAVPCRECFPTAPPPGHAIKQGEHCTVTHPDPLLAWQIEGEG